MALKNNKDVEFLAELEALLLRRKKKLPEKSYTAKLFKKGVNKIAKKLGEEAVELVIEAKDSNRDLFLNEAADLLYHYMVLLIEKDCRFSDVMAIMRARYNQK